VHARSALFDLYGDHLTSGGNWAPIAGIVRLLGPVNVAPAAVRTAVSRMVREGWLEPSGRQGQRGYAASARACARLDEARARIYRTRENHWDGQWHVVVVQHPTDRAARGRVSAALGYLGYARMAPDTWVAPRISADLADTLAAEKLGSKQFFSRYAASAEALAAELWDLQELDAAYRHFIGTTHQLLVQLSPDLTPERGFAVRTAFVHEWRKFLFLDPDLPPEVLPPDWPGREAAELFGTTAASLLPLARDFVDSCLRADGKAADIKTADIKTADIKTADIKTADIKTADIRTGS
jgi:phenylacetic acid degradation operon negative regulatory protein